MLLTSVNLILRLCGLSFRACLALVEAKGPIVLHRYQYPTLQRLEI